MIFKDPNIENEIKNSVDSDIKLRNNKYDPKRRTYGQARPTEKIIDAH